VQTSWIEVGTLKVSEMRDVRVEDGRVKGELPADGFVKLNDVMVKGSLMLSEMPSDVLIIHSQFSLSLPKDESDRLFP